MSGRGVRGRLVVGVGSVHLHVRGGPDPLHSHADAEGSEERGKTTGGEVLITE